MIQLTEQVWAIQVPDDFNDLWISDETQDHDSSQHWVLFSSKDSSQPLKSLPPGNWQYLFTTKGCTEKDARKVVDKEELFINGKSQGLLYCNYFVQHDLSEWYKYAMDSFLSLLEEKGCDINKNYAIILKQNDNGKA